MILEQQYQILRNATPKLPDFLKKISGKRILFLDGDVSPNGYLLSKDNEVTVFCENRMAKRYHEILWKDSKAKFMLENKANVNFKENSYDYVIIKNVSSIPDAKHCARLGVINENDGNTINTGEEFRKPADDENVGEPKEDSNDLRVKQGRPKSKRRNSSNTKTDGST